MPKLILNLNNDNELLVTDEEKENVFKSTADVIELLKSKNLTYYEAVEVLRLSKIALEVKCKLN